MHICGYFWGSLRYLRELGFFYIQVFPICFEVLLVGSEKSVNLDSHRKEEQRQN